MFNKKVMVLVVFLACLLSLSAVSAASDSAGDMVSADMDGEFSLDESNDGLVLSTMVETQSWGSSPKSFTDLNSLINVEYALNDTIFLNDDYVYVGEEDSPFPDEDGDYKNGVVIDRPLTIYGNGFTIDGSHLARIFDVTSSDVVFYNVNFINGCANDGGAIRGDCTVVDSTFANNEAKYGGAMYGGTAINCLFADNSVDFNGGAIYCGNAIDCTFVNNTADGPGGAIYCGNAINCTFANNTAGLYGGAMAGEINNSCNATLCTFEDTSYPYSPQLLYYVNIIYPCLNASSYLSSYGSGEKLLFNLTYGNQTFDGFNTTITVFNDTGFVGKYYGLTGPDGGWVVDLALGFYSATLSLVGYEGVNEVNITITITDGTTFCDLNKAINDNDNPVVILSSDYVYNPDYDSGFINGVEISREVTVDGDGHTIDGLHIARIFDITGPDVVIKNINFINANVSSGVGGAIYWNGIRGSIKNSTFNNNSANDGGAIYWSGSDGSAEDCIFFNNTAKFKGGSIYFEGDDFSVYNCKFINNSAKNNRTNENSEKNGGAIYSSGNNFSVYNCNFINNSAVNYEMTIWGFRVAKSYGGAIYWSGINFSVNGCNFTNNTAAGDGGAIQCSGKDSSIDNCKFINNYAEIGGGIFFAYAGTVNNCIFEGNIAERVIYYFNNGNGGAIYFAGDGNVFNSTFYKNQAKGDVGYQDHTGELIYPSGGAIYIFGNCVILNSKFYNNEAKTGSAIYSDYDNTLEVRNCEFIANKGIAGKKLKWSVNIEGYINVKIEGSNNYINAIYNENNKTILSNVTYWDGKIVNSDDGYNITKFLGVPLNLSVMDSDGNIYYNPYNTYYNSYIEDGWINAPFDLAFINYPNGNNLTFIISHDGDDYYRYLLVTLTFKKDSHDIFLSRNPSSARINTAENEFIHGDCYINFTAENCDGYYIVMTDEDGEIVYEKINRNDGSGPLDDPLISPSFNEGKNYTDLIFVDLPAGYYNITVNSLGSLWIIGSSVSKMIRILPLNSTINVDVASEVVYNNTVSVNLSGKNLTTVNVTVYDSDKNIVFTQNTTESTLTIPVLPAGTYNITAVNYGNQNISGCENSTILNILKASNNVVVSVDDVSYGEDAIVVVTADIDGNYTVNINGTLKTVEVVNGNGNTSILLNGGSYWVNASFDNPNYESIVINAAFNVLKLTTNITAIDVNTTYGVNKDIVITLKDSKENPIRGAQVTVELNGENNYTTDANGQVKVATSNLSPGTYTANITFEGNRNYAESSTAVTVKVSKVSTEISVVGDALDLEVLDEVNSGASLTPADAGNLTYTSSNSSVVKVENGMIKALGEGNAVITVSFAGDDVYAAAENKTIAVNVSLKDASVSVDNDTLDLNVGETYAIVATTTPEGLDVTFVPDDSGVVSVDDSGVVTALKEGSASIIVKVGGGDVYVENSTTVTVTVTKVSTVINVVYHKESSELVATLINNVTGKPIADVSVVISVDGENHTVNTNSSGIAKLSVVDLVAGPYTADVYYGGSVAYDSSNATVDFVVKIDTSISVVNDYVAKELIATLINNVTGQPIKSGTVRFNLNSGKYIVKTDANGQAVLSTLNLAIDVKNDIVSYYGSDKYNPSTATLEFIMNNNSFLIVDDLFVEYGGDANVVARLVEVAILIDEYIITNDDIELVSIYEYNVTFSINGENYNATTDDYGRACVNVSGLAPGTYKCAVSFEGDHDFAPSFKEFTIVVNKLSTSISAVYNAERNEFVATLINTETGAGIKGATVVMYLNGAKTNVKTDKNGQAIFAVDDDADLTAYHAAFSYGGNSKYLKSIASINGVENKATTTLSTVYDKETGEIVTTLTNTQTGAFIKGANVAIKVNGVKTTIKTDKNGQAKLSIEDLDADTYSVDTSYAGNTKYAKAATTVNIVKF